jgi:polar amino acid transport system substrate-binding protein
MKNESATSGRRSPAYLLLFMLVLLCLGGCAGTLPVPGAEQRQSLAPSGSLRVGLYPGTPTSILGDPASGAARGVGYELGKELARRLGVPFVPVVFAKNAEVLDAVKNGSVDVAFTNASPARARDMDFSTPYLEIELGFLVPPNSGITSLAEVDRPGNRVGVTEKSSSDGELTRTLKNASVVRAATVNIGVEMLASGAASAYATNKATLYEMAEALPGARVLAGRWGVERHAIAVPKGRAPGLSFAEQFAAAAKAEGLVDAAVRRAGLRGTLGADGQ